MNSTERAETPGARTIRAAVHENAIGKVTRFFHATLEDAVTEIYQNARRAGAEHIVVTVDRDRMQITDDGRGIADPGLLLSFGQSGWNAADEDPAGMGIYSLAQSGAEVASKPLGEPGWRCTLEPEHFSGARAAAVESDDTLSGHGTRVAIPLDRISGPLNGDPEKRFKAAIDTAGGLAKYLPLTVTVNGKAAPRQHFLDRERMPEHAFSAPEGDEPFRITWLNTPFYVKSNYRPAIVRWASGLAVKVTHGWTNGDEPTPVGFHGHVVWSREVNVHAAGIDGMWIAKPDISGEPGVSLVLPARKELVSDAALERVRELMRRSIYIVIARQPMTPPLPHSTWLEMHAMPDTASPPRQPRTIKAWKGQPADNAVWDSDDEPEDVTATADGIVMPEHLTPAAETVVQHALKHAKSRARLYRAEPRYAGYGWYDHLRRVTGIKVRYDEADGERTINEANDHAGPGQAVASIQVILEITDRNGGTSDIRLKTNLAFTRLHRNARGLYDVGDAGILVDAADKPSFGTLCEALERGYFVAWEDDTDNEAVQLVNFRERAKFAATTILKSDQDAVEELIRTCVFENLHERLPKDRDIRIVCRHGGGVDVTFGERTAAA